MNQSVEKKQRSAYKNQASLSLFQFFTESVNLAIVIFTAITSRSLIIWLDLINSLGNTLRVGLMMLFSRKMIKTRKQAYGPEVVKAEAMIAFFCNCLVFIGLVATFVLSVIKILWPSGADEAMLWAITFKFFCVVFDTPILVAQYKIKKQNNNQVTNSGFMGALTAFLFDAVALLSVCVVFFTREVPGSEYLSPVLSIIIAIFLMVVCIRQILKSIHSLSDKNVPEETQAEILEIIKENCDNPEIFDSVKIHYNENMICVDICIKFGDQTQYAYMKELRDVLQKKLDDDIENCIVTIVIK